MPDPDFILGAQEVLAVFMVTVLMVAATVHGVQIPLRTPRLDHQLHRLRAGYRLWQALQMLLACHSLAVRRNPELRPNLNLLRTL